jgi:hypothetical protein
MLLALALALTASPGLQGNPDVLVLADGKELACRVLFENDAKVVYRTKGTPETLERAKVREVRSIERSLRVFLERFDALAPNDAAALGELALFAETHALPGEARAIWLRVLALDPVNERAWTKLGGVQQRDGWKLKVSGRFYDLAELRKRAGDWKNPLELPTAHFRIVTDGAPERALDAAIDLERTWLTFYDVLAPHLELYVFDEVPEIRAFADPKDYPAPPTPGARAWFSPLENVLNVSLGASADPSALVSELTDTLIFNAFRRTLGKTGELERWAKNGIAQVFAAAVRPAPTKVRFDFSAPVLASFRAQAADPKPVGLDQLLGAGNQPFDSGPDQERYRTAAYTWMHFLLFGEEQRYRAKLAEFLRSSFLGKGGRSNLFRALGKDEKTLTTEWQAHVKALAGA